MTRGGTTATDLATIREGEIVEIAGAIETGDDTLWSPVTGGSYAVLDLVLVLELSHFGGFRVELIEETLACDFVLRVGTQPVLVRPPSGRLDVRGPRTTDVMSPPPDRMMTFLRDRGHWVDEPGRSITQLRYTEVRLGRGDPVSVRGLASFEIDPDPVLAGYRDPPRRLVLSAPPKGRMRFRDTE